MLGVPGGRGKSVWGRVCGILSESDGGGWAWVGQVPESLVTRGPLKGSLHLLLTIVVVLVAVVNIF